MPDAQDFEKLFLLMNAINDAVIFHHDLADVRLIAFRHNAAKFRKFSNVSTRAKIKSPSLSAAAGLSLAMNVAMSRKSSRERSVQTILKSTTQTPF